MSKTMDPDTFRDRVIKERDKVLAEYATDVEKVVDDVLAHQLEAIVLGVLGLERRFGDWEVRRHNQRGGTYPVAEAIIEHAQRYAQDKIREVLSAETVTLNPSQLASIRKVYRDTLVEQLKRHAEEIATQDAHTFVEEVLHATPEEAQVAEVAHRARDERMRGRW